MITAGAAAAQIPIEYLDRGVRVVWVGGAGQSESGQSGWDGRYGQRLGDTRLRYAHSAAEAARDAQIIVIAVDSWFASVTAAIEVAEALAAPALIIDRSSPSSVVSNGLARVVARHTRHDVLFVWGS